MHGVWNIVQRYLTERNVRKSVKIIGKYLWGSSFSYPAFWRFSKKLALAQVLLLDLEKRFIWIPLGIAIFKITFFLWHLELALNDIIILILLHSCHLRLEIP